MTSEYWAVRNRYEGLYNEAVKTVEKSKEYRLLEERLAAVNEVRRLTAKHYICTYKIHPDDEKEVLRQEGEGGYRGSYSDTMHRTDHFGYPVIHEEDSHPFPMPGAPVDVLISSPPPSLELKIPKFADFRCLNCYDESWLPSGYYCRGCMSEERLKRVNVDLLFGAILRRLGEIVKATEQTPPLCIREVITVNSTSFLKKLTFDANIRLILTAEKDVTDILYRISQKY